MIGEPHILVVEDEEHLQELLAFTLEHAGCRVSVAATGEEGVALAAREPVDLVLLDLNLPDGDGLSRAQQIRARADTPIIVLTVRQNIDDRLMAFGLGADDYIVKPCDPREVLARVHTVLGRVGKALQHPDVEAPAPSPRPTRGPSMPAPPRGGRRTAVAAAFAAAVVVAGATTWWFTQREAEVAKPVSAADDKPLAAVKADEAGRLPQVEIDPPIAATRFSWVLRSKCAQVPDVAWWTVKSHVEIAGYVVQRYAGDWKPYINSWATRLGELQDAYARHQGVRIPTGETISGDALKNLIDKTQARLDVILCLSREAAEFSHQKNLGIK